MPAVAATLESGRSSVGELDAIACGAGPGSFTSLRIAASIAKGIAVSRNLPLLVAPSTLLIATGADPALAPGEYLAALDAMRGDFFCHALRIADEGRVVPGRLWRMSRTELERGAAERGVTVIGPSEDPPRAPRARGFGPLVAQGLVRSAEVGSWEPDYGRKAEAQVRWEEAHGRALVEGA
jgi:tRNA threonylcarbamoyladenosine biosynthesis protein TsaB